MGEIVLCLLSGGVAAAAMKTIDGVIMWGLNRRAAKEDRAADKQAAEEKQEKDEITRLQEGLASLRIGERVILYDRIKHLGRKFIRDGVIDLDDRQDLIDMHSVYHNELDGNGNLDALMEDVLELPLK